MNAKAKETNVLNNYRNADPEGRFSLLMDNFASFPRLICIEERKSRYKLKAEREFLKSHTRDELGVRVQTSHIGDPTADEAVSEVSLQESFVTGEVDRDLFKGMEDALEYEMQIRMISTMRMDYELLVDERLIVCPSANHVFAPIVFGHFCRVGHKYIVIQNKLAHNVKSEMIVDQIVGNLRIFALFAQVFVQLFVGKFFVIEHRAAAENMKFSGCLVVAQRYTAIGIEMVHIVEIVVEAIVNIIRSNNHKRFTIK